MDERTPCECVEWSALGWCLILSASLSLCVQPTVMSRPLPHPGTVPGSSSVSSPCIEWLDEAGYDSAGVRARPDRLKIAVQVRSNAHREWEGQEEDDASMCGRGTRLLFVTVLTSFFFSLLRLPLSSPPPYRIRITFGVTSLRPSRAINLSKVYRSRIRLVHYKRWKIYMQMSFRCNSRKR